MRFGQSNGASQFARWLADFRCLTGFAVEVLPPGGAPGRLRAPAFCRSLKQTGACRGCLQLQTRLTQAAKKRMGPAQIVCEGGIVQVAVPVVSAGRVLGTLFGGKVRLHRSPPRPIAEMAHCLGAGPLAPAQLKRLSSEYDELTVYGRAQLAAAKRLLQHLAEAIGDSFVSVSAGWAAKEPALVMRARQFIRQHEGGRLTTEAVAKALKLNTSYFCRAFRRATGLTFHAYLAKMRVEAAATALRNTEQSITSAGYSAGFQSSSDFNRVFKAVLGITPTEFRAKSNR